MKKQIKVNQDPKTGEQFFKLNDFKDMFDISKIEYYELVKVDNKIVLTFYDKDKNQLTPIK